MAKDFSILPTGTIEAYINSAYQIPVLTPEEERSLALRLRDQNDMEAAKRLVTSHLRFVIRIARGYLGYGLPLPDLIQEGTVGLMKAVRRFEPDMGVRLVSFAVHWIRAEIHEYILRNWRIVKVATTKAQRKLFFNLRSSKKRLGWMTKQEVEDVAADLGVKPEVVLQMESRHPRPICLMCAWSRHAYWSMKTRIAISVNGSTRLSKTWTNAAKPSSLSAGCRKRSRLCTNWPINSVFRPSVSGRSRRTP